MVIPASVTLAEAFIRSKYDIQGELKVANASVKWFEHLGVELELVKLIEHMRTDDSRFYTLYVNRSTGEIYEDRGAVDLAERAYVFDARGKLSPDLIAVLEEMADDDMIKVGIWMAGDDPSLALPELQERLYGELAAAYPAAAEAMAQYGSPFAVSDEALRKELQERYREGLAEAAAQRTTPIEQLLQEHGYEYFKPGSTPAIIVRLPKSFILSLRDHPHVGMIYNAEGEQESFMNSAADEHQAPEVWNRGFDGSGWKIAILDAGNIDTTLNCITHDTVKLVSALGVKEHATLVASAAGCDDPYFPGVAKGATLTSAATDQGGDVVSDMIFALEWALSSQNIPIAAQTTGIEQSVSNLHIVDRASDYWVRATRALVAMAAGNGGSLPLPSPAKAYNVLTVGGYFDGQDIMYTPSQYINPCSEISCLTDREKPEVVGVGQELTIVKSNGGWATNEHGTSFAVPQAAAIGTLMLQSSHPFLNDFGEIMKAILMASASQNITDAFVIIPGQDLKDGAGAINALHADDVAQNVGTSIPCATSCFWKLKASNIPLNGSTYKELSLDAGEYARVALTWYSNPDSPPNYSSDSLDTDLELSVDQNISGIWQTIAVSAFDDNNYEMVEFQAPTTGVYRLHVAKTASIESQNYIGLAALTDYTRCSPELSIQQVGGTNDIQVNWTALGGSYDVFLHTDPYLEAFDSGAGQFTNTSGSFIHNNGAGDPNDNHYYVVKKISGEEPLSVCLPVGEFDFALVPGTP